MYVDNICVYIYICTYIQICMYMCIYIYIYIGQKGVIAGHGEIRMFAPRGKSAHCSDGEFLRPSFVALFYMFRDPARFAMTLLTMTPLCPFQSSTANIRTRILDFRGFDSSRILMLRGGILMSIGSSPEMLSQRILVGTILVGRLGACFLSAGILTSIGIVCSLTRPWVF